ncbi:hypothetical protein Hanom_Chr04g00327401 [Helianthus anomalus]
MTAGGGGGGGCRKRIYPKNFYRTGGSKTYIPKNFYTRTTYITLRCEKFRGSGAPGPFYTSTLKISDVINSSSIIQKHQF